MGNFYSWLYLSCAVLIFISGAVVLRHNPRQAVNRKYAVFCVPFFIWICTYSLTLGLSNYLSDTQALILCKIGYTGIIFIPVTLIDFIFIFFDKKKPILISTGYIVSIIFITILWNSSLIIKGVHHYPWGIYPKAGFLHPYFLAFFFAGSTIFLYKAIYSPFDPLLNSQKSNQGKYLIPFYVILAFDSVDFLPNYGINIYPIGWFLTNIFVLSIAYGILKYQLMDIKIVLQRSLVYSLLVTVMTIIYFLTIFVSEKILQHIVGYKTFVGSLFASLILAFTFIPLRNYFQKLVDKIIFGKTPTEIAEENDKLQEELSRREKYTMAAKLAGNVAHEIKNPLTAINTFIQQFPEKKDDPEFIKTFHTLASSELERIKQLSYQLMDFAKPAELKLSEFDLHQLLENVLLLTNQRLQNQNVKLNKQFTTESLTLSGDKDQLKQVFLNLILNAVDAMDNGGTLTVETRFDTKTVGAQCAVPLQNYVQIRITDTGCGISEQNLKKLFEPFFTTKKDGTGLGLSICKRIIETHGGKMEVKSQINNGTTFSMILPLTNNGGADA